MSTIVYAAPPFPQVYQYIWLNMYTIHTNSGIGNKYQNVLHQNTLKMCVPHPPPLPLPLPPPTSHVII